ncbi:AsmA family protein [Halomonas sp. WWR20]
MIKTARRIFAALVGLGLLLLMAMLLLESSWTRNWLEGQVSQRLEGRPVEIGSLDIGWGWPLNIHLEDIRVANTDWATHERMLQIQALNIAVDTGQLLQGNIQLTRIDLQQPVAHLARNAQGVANWAALAGGSDSGGSSLQPEVIAIDQGRLTYQDPILDADITLDVHTTSQGPDSQRLQIQGQGRFQGKPLEFQAQGGAPSRVLAEEPQPYPATLDGHLGEIRIHFDGQSQDIQRLASLQGQVSVSAPASADIAALLGRQQPQIPALDIQGRLSHQGQRWALREIEAQVGQSQLTGSLAWRRGETPRLQAQIEADRFDLNRWGLMELLKGGEQETASGNWRQRLAQQLAPLRRYQGQMDVTVARLDYGDEVLRNVALQAQLADGRLDVQRLHARQDNGELSAQGWVEVQPDTLQGKVEARMDRLDLGEALAPLGHGDLGTLDGDLHAKLSSRGLTVQETDLAYQFPNQALSVQLHAESREIKATQAPGVHVEGSGIRQGQPFQFDLVIGPLLQLLDADPYPVSGTVASRDTSVRLDGTVTRPLDPSAADVMLHGQGNSLATVNHLIDLNEWTGLDVPTDSPFTLDTRLRLEHLNQENLLWALQDFEARVGDNHWTGSVSVAMGETPRIDAQVDAKWLDLNRWGVMEMLRGDEEDASQEQASSDAAASDSQKQRWAQQLAPLRRYQGQVDIGLERLSYGEEVLRDVAVVGQLDNGRLDVQRLHAVQGEGELSVQGWLDVQPQTPRGEFDAQLDQVDLGQALAPLGHAALGTLDGEIHVALEDAALTLRDTDLAYRSPARDWRVQLHAESQEIQGVAAPGVHIEGRGARHQQPFRFDLVLGPLLDLNDPDKPYPVSGTLASRQTSAYVDGTITQPLKLGAVDTQFHIAGPNPARINVLTGLNLPAVPPYELEGRLRGNSQLLRLNNLRGQFGDSDIRGDVRLEWEQRSMLWATLHSRKLDFDDLRPLWGAAPEIGEGETASPQQRQRAQRQHQQTSLFPDEDWDLAGLRRMDAEVHYTAADISASSVPLNDARFELTLDQGVLMLEPLRIGLGTGEVTGQLRLDARQAPMNGRLQLSARGVNLKPLLRRADLPDIAQDSAGILGGETQLRFHGRSMDEVMANLNGKLELAMSGGHLDMLTVEILGLDAGEALVAKLADSDQVPMQCAYARLNAENGLAKLEQFFIGTRDSNFTGGGTIDLGAERMQLAFEGHPKDISFLESASPVKLEGPLRSPQVSVMSAELIARGAASIIGALIAPPLAILPWVDLGLGEDAGPGCRQVMDEFQTQNDRR